MRLQDQPLHPQASGGVAGSNAVSLSTEKERAQVRASVRRRVTANLEKHRRMEIRRAAVEAERAKQRHTPRLSRPSTVATYVLRGRRVLCVQRQHSLHSRRDETQTSESTMVCVVWRVSPLCFSAVQDGAVGGWSKHDQ